MSKSDEAAAATRPCTGWLSARRLCWVRERISSLYF